MRTYVIGSRELENLNTFNELFSKLPIPDYYILGGGEEGVDAFAEIFCRKNKISYKILYPDFKNDGKGAVFKRNIRAIEESTDIVAFHNLDSKGTFITCSKAMYKKKNLKVVYFEMPSEIRSNDIVGFYDENAWLSNLWPTSPLSNEKLFGDLKFHSVENAYQASKFIGDEETCGIISEMTPIEARIFGNENKPITESWPARSNDSMLYWLKQKFECPFLNKKLDLTGNFGIYNACNIPSEKFECDLNKRGQNILGKMLEKIRQENRINKNQTYC